MKFKISVTDEQALLNKEQYQAVVKALHLAWRESPNFHRICTESLLIFDTEAGGTTMNLSTPATTPEKEEK